MVLVMVVRINENWGKDSVVKGDMKFWQDPPRFFYTKVSALNQKEKWYKEKLRKKEERNLKERAGFYLEKFTFDKNPLN